jgi:hypothetical protein
MTHDSELGHDRGLISVQVITKHGEEIRRYRRPLEKRATIFGGIVILLATGIPLLMYLTSHTAHLGQSLIPIALLLMLYIAIFASYFIYNNRVGVEASNRGVSSVSLTRSVFVEWQNIAIFVVDHYTPLSVCVLAERLDGSRVPLNALATWAYSSRGLYPYRDALNEERQARIIPPRLR